MDSVLTINKALSDKNRLRALLALRNRELCLCQIIELLQLAPSTVSKHMTILRQANLVLSRKEGRWIYYRQQTDAQYAQQQQAASWVCDSLAESAEILEDNQRLEQILNIDPEQLCRQQCGK